MVNTKKIVNEQVGLFKDPHPKPISFYKIYTFQRCPFEYKCRFLDENGALYDRKGPNVSCGISLHLTLKEFFKINLIEERTPENLLSLLDKYWQGQGFPGTDIIQEEWHRKAREIIIKCFHIIKPHSRPVKIETRFRASVNDIMLSGIIDRIDYLFDMEGYEVIDYKLEEYKDESNILDLQPVLYYFGAKSILGVPPIKLTYIYLNECRIETISINEDKANRGLEELKNVIKRINNTKEFRPRRNILCLACGAKKICPLEQKIDNK